MARGRTESRGDSDSIKRILDEDVAQDYTLVKLAEDMQELKTTLRQILKHAECITGELIIEEDLEC